MDGPEKEGWWAEQRAALDPTDQSFLVIVPHAEAPAEALRYLGATLKRWRATRPDVRHIWGLGELLAGEFPRTPPDCLGVPHPLERYEERYESVALLCVAAGADLRAEADQLVPLLEPLQPMLAWVTDPFTYSQWNR
ncbi:hypothetical protein [Paludisphaera soli]|uniref:hypothetical protein n=1 Tax=Paludisphaera soli TaxID=2712865 RepID=UPI0013EA2FAE|nr:hypothetical protein [Paludisphaera soli]